MSIKRRNLFIFLAFVLLSCAFVTGASASLTGADTPRLRISVTPADEAYLSEDILQGDSKTGYCCIGLEDVTIVIDNITLDLGYALRESRTSLAELSFLAQSDALAGFCTEQWDSKNGLAKFCYSYPEFDIWFTHDIYETPDNSQHLIQQVTLVQPGSNVISAYNELDQEDWGIQFTVAKASPTEITLNYTQSGGQLIGQLMTCGYEISRLNPLKAIPQIDGAPLQEQIPICHNVQSNITLDFETFFGVLPAGQYRMYLYLQDSYSEQDIPPLTQNYHDIQCYGIEFVIS